MVSKIWGSAWNPWHGCNKLSAGCKYCFVYRMDAKYGKDSSIISKTQNFNLPLKKKRTGEYKLTSGLVIPTCFTSDFFLQEADEWRMKAWQMIRQRRDLHFMFVTKRIDRFYVNLPDDWGKGYENVTIGCTVENQKMADYRLPIFKETPIKRKIIICEPLLEPINLMPYLDKSIIQIVVGGESGDESRVCDYEWVLALREQCAVHHLSFWFKQTGARFFKDGKLYRIKKPLQHSQARKAGIDINRQLF